jgi:CTP:molybdopterin cytidylyltransferase MocA
MSGERLFAVVLAGGSGSRFGSTKQLAVVGDQPMVARAVATAEAICGPRTVLVTGNEWAAVVDAARPKQGFFVVNEAHASGLSGSIAVGVRSVRRQADAVMLLLADQPLVTPVHLQQLEQTWRRDRESIVASAYANTCGPPVIFPAAYFDELMSLTGDKGARAVIDAHRDRLIEIAFEDAAIDVDTRADLENLQPDAASGCT